MPAQWAWSGKAHSLLCTEVRLALAVEDWRQFNALFDHALETVLHVEPKEHPLLLAEPSFSTRSLHVPAHLFS